MSTWTLSQFKKLTEDTQREIKRLRKHYKVPDEISLEWNSFMHARQQLSDAIDIALAPPEDSIS